MDIDESDAEVHNSISALDGIDDLMALLCDCFYNGARVRLSIDACVRKHYCCGGGLLCRLFLLLRGSAAQAQGCAHTRSDHEFAE